MRLYYVYILASHSNTPVLYIGVTNDLERRLYEHKERLVIGFAEKYHCDKLVYWQETVSIEAAIAQEKQLKRWHRVWKLNLIRQSNPNLHDISREWDNQEILNQVQDDKVGAA